MIFVRADYNIMLKPGTRELRKRYEECFGYDLYFNYQDFHTKDGKRAAEWYVEALKQAIETGVPFESHYDPKYEIDPANALIDEV